MIGVIVENVELNAMAATTKKTRRETITRLMVLSAAGIKGGLG
jgi:hypothetical protein